MKKLLLGASLLCMTGAMAQIKPTTVLTATDIYSLRKEIPAIREGFTKMKVRLRENANSLVTWYDFNVGVTSNVITSTAFANINPSFPLSDEYRTTGSKTGNIYTSMVEWNDQGSWEAYSKETVYFDAAGKDTLWMVEEYDGTNYNPHSKTAILYNAEGRYSGYNQYLYTNSEWFLVSSRSIKYTGGERTSDSTFLDVQGVSVPKEYSNYTYVSGKLDSVSHSVFNNINSQFEFAYSMKLTTGTDGGVDEILTYRFNDSIVVESYAEFTGGLVTGVKELNENNFNIYPVPANNALNIDMKEAGVVNAQLFDIQGKLMHTETIAANGSINTASFNNGIYILQLQNEQGYIMTKRIVINH